MAHRKSRANHTGRSPRDEVEEISFEDEESGRIGDERSREEASREFPPERVRAAGLTGGEAQPLGQDITSDDMSPETLLDEEGAEAPSAYASEDEKPADKSLRIVEGAEIGGGSGKDEAELAQENVRSRENTERR